MKNTTQAKPSAWSLAEEVPEGQTWVLSVPQWQRSFPPGVMERAALVPGWCLQLSLMLESTGELGWYPCSQGPLTYSNLCCFHPPLFFIYESEREVSQLCPTLCDPVDCSPSGFSTHGILQARILEWVAISFSRGSSRPRDRTQVSCNAGRHLTLWAMRSE